MFRSGRILMIDETAFETITLVPNIQLVDAVFDRYKEVQEIYEKDNNYSTFRSARINFIKEAISILWNYGSFSKSAEYYKKLQAEEPGSHKLPLEAFVMQQWAEEVRDASVKKASEIVSGLIMRSMFYLIYNDHDAAVANERMARYIYNKYQKEMGGEARTTLPPYNEMKKSMVETLSKTLNPVMAEILKQRVQEDQAAAPAVGPLKSDQ